MSFQDVAPDAPVGTSANLQSVLAANSTPANQTAISNSTTLHHEPEQLNGVGPLSRAVTSPLQLGDEAAPAAAHRPVERRPKPRTTPKSNPQGDRAGRRPTIADRLREKGRRAERSTGGWGGLGGLIRNMRGSKSKVPRESVPQKPWGSELKEPRGNQESRPEFPRTMGSLLRAWDMYPPSGPPLRSGE